MSSTAARRPVPVRRIGAAVLTSALLVLGVTACSTQDDSVKTTPDSTANSASASGAPSAKASAKSTAPKAAKVGDTLVLKGMNGGQEAVTVVKVVTTAQSTDEFSQPDAGKRFYAVQFRLKNVGKTAYQDSPSNGAKVVDGQGQGYDADYNDTKAGQSFPADVTIAPGDSALGFITFQVPKTAKIVKIHFGLDSGFADQTGQWTVS